ncbi:MAG: C-terminal helicase domain-containing protein [Nitrososphaeraceae archaeon]
MGQTHFILDVENSFCSASNMLTVIISEQKIIEKEADILITSDVLSEGQNLQDCNYAINYDLPWNPMKIVQRVGRIDRLTSKHRTVTSAVFFPEKELEDELGLLVILNIKIKYILY